MVSQYRNATQTKYIQVERVNIGLPNYQIRPYLKHRPHRREYCDGTWWDRDLRAAARNRGLYATYMPHSEFDIPIARFVPLTGPNFRLQQPQANNVFALPACASPPAPHQYNSLLFSKSHNMRARESGFESSKFKSGN